MTGEVDKHTAELLGWSGDEASEAQTEVEQAPEAESQQQPAQDLGLSDDPGTHADPEPQQREDTGVADPQVPSGRLREESERRRQAEQALQAERDRINTMEQRFQMLQEVVQGSQEERKKALEPQPETPPDPETDVVGYLRYMEKRNADQEAKIGRLEQASQEVNQKTEQQQLIEHVRSRAAADAADFAREAPDFHQAYQWLRQNRVAELTAAGINPQVAQARIDQEEIQLTAFRLQNNMNSAEAFYAMAKARGWQGQQPQAMQATGTDNVTAFPQQQVQPMQAAPPPAHRQTLNNMETAMRQSRTLDEASSGGAGMPDSLETMANWSEAQFAANIDKVKARMKQSIR